MRRMGGLKCLNVVYDLPREQQTKLSNAARTMLLVPQTPHTHTHTHTHTMYVTNGQQPRQRAAIKEAGLH